MSVLDRAFSGMTMQRSANSRSVFDGLFSFGAITSSGTIVDHKSALKLSAVFDAVEQRSNSVAMTPFGVYQTTDEGRKRVYDHPVDAILSVEPDGPDGYLTPFVFKKITETSKLLRGNALWHIKSNEGGEIRLKFIPWDDVRDIRHLEGVLYYFIKGMDEPLMQSEVLHFKGFTTDGRVGISAITYGAMSMGYAMDVQHFAGMSVQNKGVRTGVIETDKALGSTQKQYADNATVKEMIKAGWKSSMREAGPDRVVVLDDGLKFKPITLSPQDAQIIELSNFTIEDICRWFNVPPHKLKSLRQSTNNNIEQQALEYVGDTVQPDITNYEQEFAKKLLSAKERGNGFYIKGNMNVLYRADMQARGEYLSKMVNGGIMTPNEARALEELNDDPNGNELRQPVNTQTLTQMNNKSGNE